MKGWKKPVIAIIGIFLIPGTLGFSSCQGRTADFEICEPTKNQLILLEKVYNQMGKLQYLGKEGEIRVRWESEYKKRFDQLCGEETGPFFLEADYYQNPRETLERNGGDCEDFAILFVSAAKSLGISARVVGGEIFDPKENEFKSHSWCEIYYPRLKLWQRATISECGRLCSNREPR